MRERESMGEGMKNYHSGLLGRERERGREREEDKERCDVMYGVCIFRSRY